MGLVTDGDARRRSRARRRATSAVPLALVALVGACATTPGTTVLVAHEAPATRPAAAASAAVVVQPLVVTSDVSRATVRVGQVVRVRLRWADGDGRLAGTTEDWGDVGAGSGRLTACRPDAAPRRAGGVVALAHAYAAAGVYTAHLSVLTQACRRGGAVHTEERAATVRVTVTR